MNLIIISVCQKPVSEKYLILIFAAKWEYSAVQHGSDYGWCSCCAPG